MQKKRRQSKTKINNAGELVVVEDNAGEGKSDAAGTKKEKKSKGTNLKKNTKRKNLKDNCNGNVTESSSLYKFPMQRVERMIKEEDPSIRISQDAVFAINKASEKFIELLTKEAYACAFLDHEKFVAYNHLSSVVAKRRKFDFLSDFIPEKLKVEDALKEIP